ncbi:MAG: ABC transporter permease [Bacteroidota bacterium]|nr:ABC transporter permease [Bacteroidota bacterium]
MNLPFFIAKRYLFSKKKTNAVNLITGVSILGITVGTAAMIIVLSAFNGLEDLVRSFYDTFDPDLKVELVKGKNWQWTDDQAAKLEQVEGIDAYSLVLEEKALLRYRDKEFIATLKGVDGNYLRATQFEDALIRGEFFVQEDTRAAIPGLGVSYHLSLSSKVDRQPIDVYVPRDDFSPMLDPTAAFTTETLNPVGTFSVQPDFDVKYVITPLAFVRGLVGKDKISAIEVKVAQGADEESVRHSLETVMGSKFTVKTRDEQQATLFRVMKTEGLVTFLILAFILAIASFTILGSLTMLILDKKEDIITLWNLGADERFLKRTFMLEGLLIAGIGAGTGLILGLGIVWAQQNYGLIQLGQGYAMEAYPVALRLMDFVKVMVTVMGISLAITMVATRRLKVERLQV